MICRLCKKHDNVPVFKYSVRHYAHARCAFAKWGAAFLDMIPAHMIGQLSAGAVQDAGLFDKCMKRMASEQREGK